MAVVLPPREPIADDGGNVERDQTSQHDGVVEEGFAAYPESRFSAAASFARQAVAELAEYCFIEAEGVGGYAHGNARSEELVREACARMGGSPAHALQSLLRRGERSLVADLQTPPYRRRTFDRVLLRALGDVGFRWVFATAVELEGRPLGRMVLLGAHGPLGSSQVVAANDLAAQLAKVLAPDGRPSEVRRIVGGRLERISLLADASRELASSLDPQVTLERLAQILVPKLADGCAIDVMDDDGAIRRAAVAHVNPEKERLFARDRERDPIDPSSGHPIACAIRSGASVLVPEVPSRELGRFLERREASQYVETSDVASYMILPMCARGRTLGAITLVFEESGRRFEEDDLVFGEDLASRASLAFDNARLYDLAQRTAREREDLVAIVSHDLKNPLAAIGFSAVTLKRSFEEARTGDSASRAVEVVRRSVARMQTLIHDLLDLGRMEGGRLPIAPQTCDAQTLVLEACELVRSIASQKDVTLEEHIDFVIGPLMCDAGRILQVMSNLLDNALKFTPDGGVVRVSLKADGTGFARISVADRGPGIKKCDLTRVFDRYWQAAGAPRSGYGLGLAIAKGVIDAHRGRIWAESAVGEGSTFAFTLPLAHPVERREKL